MPHQCPLLCQRPQRSPVELSETQLTEVGAETLGVNSFSNSQLFQEALKSRCNPAGLSRRDSLILPPPSLPDNPSWVSHQSWGIDPCLQPEVPWKKRIIGNRQLELFQECTHFLEHLSTAGFCVEAPGQLVWLCPSYRLVVGEELPPAGHLPGADVHLGETWIHLGTVQVTPSRDPYTTPRWSTAGRED